IEVGLDVVSLLAAAGAGVACLWAARRAELTRPTWQLLAVGCLIWLVGALVDAGGAEASTSGRGARALGFAIVGSIGLVQLVRRGRRPRYGRAEVVGALLAGVVTLAVGFEFLIRPIAGETVAAADRGAQRVELGLQAGAVGLAVPLAVALVL